ncbi:MAG: tyrosine-type recombinase/integrase [bacterium]
MKTSVMSVTDKVLTRIGNNGTRPYLEAFRLDCEVRNLSRKTIDVYFERLGYLLTWLGGHEITFNDITRRTVQSYIVDLKGSVSDETINGRIRAFRRFFNFLVTDGLWEEESPLSGVKLLRTADRVKPVIDPETIQKVIASLSRKTFESSRNLVMVLLLWDCMLRRNELLGLRISDIDIQSRLVKVFGKGRKERMVPIGVKTLKALHQFLIKWRSKYPGDLLICMRNGEPVTERHCHKIIQHMGQKHGIKLYPHLLRHSAATWYIRQGGNPAVLQGILGHTSLLVTQKYVHLSSQDAVRSYDSFSPSNCLRI